VIPITEPHFCGIQLSRTSRPSFGTLRSRRLLLWRKEQTKSSTGRTSKRVSTSRHSPVKAASLNTAAIRILWPLLSAAGLNDGNTERYEVVASVSATIRQELINLPRGLYAGAHHRQPVANEVVTSGLATIRPHYDWGMRIANSIRLKAAMYLLLTAQVASLGCRRNRLVEQAEYDVISAYVNQRVLIESEAGRGHPADRRALRIVIVAVSGSDHGPLNSFYDSKGQLIPWSKSGDWLQGKEPALQRATFQDFRQRNMHPTTFQSSFHLSIPFQLIAQSDLDAILEGGGGWPAFYKRFPNSSGVITFSRVGFSPDGKQAIFLESHGCGPLCGSGSYVIMRKDDTGWATEKIVETWVS